MKMLTFANRNTKEILRDPVNLFFGVGFPLVLILLLSAIQANIPVSLFEIDRLTPGITVFGLTFMTLITNAMNLFLVSPTVQDLIRYLIVLAAVILDNAQANARAKKLA